MSDLTHWWDSETERRDYTTKSGVYLEPERYLMFCGAWVHVDELQSTNMAWISSGGDVLGAVPTCTACILLRLERIAMEEEE